MEQLLEELSWRGLLHDQTPRLQERLAEGPIAGYVGFDPTARSLQIGNLVPVMLLAHLQRHGGRPIVVVGGGTGLIGDPSGKSTERPLLDEETINRNAERQRNQLAQFLEFDDSTTGAQIINNAEWLRDLNLLEFLRDMGKHFTLSYMLQKESVKGRMAEGISYTEFSYMLLQAYDFLQLQRTMHCELQLGGSDQWGNITAGIELIRRVDGGKAHGLCAPLLTTASGKKFGKTEAGSVWLDPTMTRPYEFYQFWVNLDDRDVEAKLKIFTFMTGVEISELMAQHSMNPGRRIPHKKMAFDITARVHGGEIARRTAEASETVFGERSLAEASERTLKMIAAELPHGPMPVGFGSETAVVDLVNSSGVVTSKSDARRQIEQGAICINDRKVATSDSTVGPPLDGGYYWVRRGKKTNFIFVPST